MLDMLCWLGFMTVCSLMFGYLVRRDLGPFKTILLILGIFGLLIHEISHVLFSVLTGVRVNGFRISIKSKSTGRLAPSGAVAVDENRSFMQQVMIAIAPLIVQTWMFLFCLDLIIAPGMDPLVIIVLSFLIVSLFIGANPSSQDLRGIPHYFTQNLRGTRYSWFQLMVAIISFLITLVFIDFSWMLVPYEVMIYMMQFFMMFLMYYFIKYFFLGLRKLLVLLTRSTRQAGSRPIGSQHSDAGNLYRTEEW